MITIFLMRSTLLTIGTLAFVLQPLAASAATITPAQAMQLAQEVYGNTGPVVVGIAGDSKLTFDQKFSSISNVLKTKHDTVKNSINNVR